MMRWFRRSASRMCLAALALVPALGLSANAVRGDEGMWLFNRVPKELLKTKYGFEPTDQWLEHLRLSSVRFNSGGSGSFVSSRGLVMTNHHVGADALQKLSSAERDLLEEGFHAKTEADELKCVDLELNVLVHIEDVTAKVNAAVKPGSSAAEAFAARRAVINTIEEEQHQKTGLRSDVVTLYQGGEYHLYQFKKYTDVRLVFAPEQGIAFFGGDPDNFEYPRYCLDVCFFRVYEDGKPAKMEHFLKWSEAGAADDELTFVSGHPGSTSRLNTMAHLEYLRDLSLPQTMDVLRRREVMLTNFSERSLENARQAKDDLFGIQNSRKSELGGLAGLQDPVVMRQKRAEEESLRKAVAAKPGLQKKYGTAWDEVAGSLEHLKEFRRELSLFEFGAAFNTSLFGIARTLVRMAEEDTKPNAERLDSYTTAARESLEQGLYSEAPLYPDLEIAKLADSLAMLVEHLGPDHPLVAKVLAGQSPRERAAALIRGSRLIDVEERRKLAKAGQKGIESSDDPLIGLARLIDPRGRELRKRYEEQVEEPQRQAYAKVAAARFAVLGSGTYPDATFTLRLAFGPVKGYEEAGNQIPPWTQLGGTYAHAEAHGSEGQFQLPKRWLEGRDKLKASTPFNFVNTADIIGGNSGSPVVNRQAEVVGIIFDGNIQSLVSDYVYSDTQARAVSVHSSAIRETLRDLYGAKALADELGQ